MVSMWGKKQVESKQSAFYEGNNVFNYLIQSLYGKITSIVKEIFGEEDINKYNLPKVIVIGNESTGKSSLLENITKCQIFPKDSKVCTKCPVHVVLKTGEPKYEISYYAPIKSHHELVTKVIDKKEDIYITVGDYMKTLPDDQISSFEVTIRIQDVNVPSFEFYDLPGIRSYPPKMAETTTELCKKYLSDKNAIVLCVVPATTTRLTSCQSIALITEAKMEHNSILALTMADRLQSENIEELLIKRITGQSDELKKINLSGIVSVVNRTHANTKTLVENDTNELAWFKDNILNFIPEEFEKTGDADKIRANVTVANLIGQMDKLYNKFIHVEWKPNIIKDMAKNIASLKEEYKAIGDENLTVEAVTKDILTSMKYDIEIMDGLCVVTDLDKYKKDAAKYHYDCGNFSTAAKLYGDAICIENAHALYMDGKTNVSMRIFRALNSTGVFDLEMKKMQSNYIKQIPINIINIMNMWSEKYKEFALKYLLADLDDRLFDSELELERFPKLYEYLVEVTTKRFQNLCNKECQNILNTCVMKVYDSVADETLIDITILLNKFDRMWYVFIINQMSKINLSITKDMLVESDAVKKKRTKLKALIEKNEKYKKDIEKLI